MKAVTDVYPLSPLQRGLLFHALFSAGSGAYVEQFSYCIEGTLDMAAFAHAWNTVIERHDALRTSILWEGLDQPVQLVHPSAEAPIRQEDWRGLGQSDIDRRLNEFLLTDCTGGFDLTTAPLIRLAVFTVDDNRLWLTLTFHHVILDGWSMYSALHEVFTIYAAALRGETPDLPDPAQFRSYIGWLKNCPPLETNWRENLRGLQDTSTLQWLRNSSATAPNDGAAIDEYVTILRRLPADLTECLSRICLANRVTLSSVTQAGWALALHFYSTTSDIVFGSVFSCRPAEIPNIESMIGLLVNTQPLRVQIDAKSSLLDVVRGLGRRCAEIQSHPHASLVDIHSWSGLPPGTPLFDSLFAFENHPRQTTTRSNFPGFRIVASRVAEQSDYPLTLRISPGDQLKVALTYSTRVFEGCSIERLLDSYEAALRRMAETPDALVADLEIRSETERRLLATWNATDHPFNPDVRLERLFLRQVERSPQATAVVFEGGHWSYADLNRRAQAVARRLRSSGVRRGDCVGIYLSRRPEMVSSALGVLTAGAAYVPMDGSAPVARLRQIASATRMRCVISEAERGEKLGRLQEVWPELQSVIKIEDEELSVEAPLRREEEEGEEEKATAAELAYVIFTSGSTGEPKGVMVAHRAVVNLIEWLNRAFEVGERDRVLMVASLSFDLSVYDIFGLLAGGGSVRIATEEEMKEPDRLVKLLNEGGITIWDSAPAALQQLRGEFPRGNRESGLRLALLSGDWIPVPLPDEVREAWPGAEVVALGGGTEATVWSNYYRVRRVERSWPSIPYGRPIQNASYYVLDKVMGEQPIGVGGDLYIGGECLAEGYAGSPGLSAEKFRPNPYGGPGSRLYRTGDLARWRADGEMEFLGRRDHQVKVRGYRIELGEVEAALRDCAAVKDAVAGALGEAGEQKRLVAWVVEREGMEVSVAELRRELEERLPDYMIPAAFIKLDRLPVTSNGKLDRRALPQPDASRPQMPLDYTEPSDPVEEIIAGLCADLLKVERPGAQDNFFELGGHSLTAVQLIARMRKIFEVELSFNTVFHHPTISSLADQVKTASRLASALPAPLPLARDGDFPLSYEQQRLWFMMQLDPKTAAYTIPLAVRLRGDLDAQALQKALNLVAHRHEALRTVFPSIQGAPRQRILEGISASFPVIDLGGLNKFERMEALQRTIERFCYHPMDIATGPLLRTALVRLAERDHALVVALHHLITDGWSTGILARDISAFYRAIVSNAAPPANLPVLPVQYGDYAAWQRAALESGSFDEHRIYWKRQLDGPLPRLDFSRFAGPRREKGIGGYYPIKWPASLYKRIVAAGRNHDATVFMTVLSAYACAVHQITSQTDIIVGTDIATRRMSSLENLIGLFINQIPIRLRLSSSLTFSGLLRHARSTTLASYAHAELPFDGIVRSVNPKRSAGDTPILQIMFVYFNAPRHSLDLPDVQVEPIELNAMTSRFDLSLQLSGSDSGMRGYWIYSTAVFDQDAIARFSNRFELLLDRALANPDSSIDSLLAALETADDQENLLTARLQSRRQRSSRFAVTHHDPARNQ